MILADARGRWEVHRCRNTQNEQHRQDPVAFPRDARSAYFLDPEELFPLTRRVAAGQAAWVAFYHSHPDADAYFSAEDRQGAVPAPWREPLYPGVIYLVLSVRDRMVRDIKGFRWSPADRAFVEGAVRGFPNN